MKRLAGISLMVGLLSGCAAGTSELSVRLETYTREEQAEMSLLLPTLPPLVQRFINDYGKLRAEVRASR